jgi:hypothetical protein
MRAFALAALLCSAVVSASEGDAFTAGAGVGFLNRSFSWVGDPNAGFIPASQPFAGAIAVDASWYPGAHTSTGPGSWFGVFGQADFGFGLASRLANSTTVFAQQASRIRAGGVARFPLGEKASLLLHAGYARQSFTTSTTAVNGPSARPNAPDVLFDGPRGGLGFRFKLGSSVELEVLGGVQYVTGFGELATSSWFPRATAFATDAALGLSIHVADHFRVRLSGQWQRTFLTLHRSAFPEQSAAEQYLTGAVALQWAM